MGKVSFRSVTCEEERNSVFGERTPINWRPGGGFGRLGLGLSSPKLNPNGPQAPGVGWFSVGLKAPLALLGF